MLSSHEFDPAVMELKVVEFLHTWPATVQVFFTFQLACVGCAFDAFHTIADAVDTYDLPRELFIPELLKHMSVQEASDATRPLEGG